MKLFSATRLLTSLFYLVPLRYRVVFMISVAMVYALTSALSIPKANAAQPQIEGRVVSVADGDTLTVLDSTNTQHRIRLAQIDAPEIPHGNQHGQPFGQASKQSLSAVCFGKSATVHVVQTDRYGRTVGTVICEGINANVIQVQRGMAMVYRQYASDQHLFALEASAKEQRLGLWADPSPQAPWDYRHGN